MLRKLSLVAVAAASLGAAALAPTSASAWAAAGTMAAGIIIIITAGVAPASSSAGRPITVVADMAAATRGAWFRPPGVRAGGW